MNSKNSTPYIQVHWSEDRAGQEAFPLCVVIGTHQTDTWSPNFRIVIQGPRHLLFGSPWRWRTFSREATPGNYLCLGRLDIQILGPAMPNLIADIMCTYRIQNCFSTISTKILVNHYYFRDLWRILECKSLWITHIFAIYSDLSVVSILMVISAIPNHQLWWFLVWFICRITKFFANSSDFLSDYICFLPVLLFNWLSFLNINFRLTTWLTFHLYFPHT